nr:hypothetical protein [uncultured Pseudomonas sp.]
MRKLLVFLALSASVSYAGGWIDKDGNPAPESQNRKSSGNFSAMLLVTPNGTWEEKWNTPSQVTPDFQEVEIAKIGDEFAVLTIFANPKPDINNNVNVVCSLRVTRPDNTTAVSEDNIPCLQGPLHGPASNIRLSPAILKFVAESTDPEGIWLVDATVEDKNRNIKLELKTQYEFTGADG